ncbi:glycosyltransferase family 2 protein [Lactococcus lactis]|uniref:glycosyltransferase family 2 protein n=1 Tax=Lactococcus lactis TaxID=1358 RepID=UPI00300DD84E
MSINKTEIEEDKVSVIVPVYNVEEYIRECIKSIQVQTYSNLEIIVVNDGTKDKSIEIIKDLIEMDSRIRVISQPNQGLSAARNTGIENATGKYVAMIDSDDKIKPDFIKHLFDVADSQNADIVRGSFRDFEGNIPRGWIADFTTNSNSGLNVLNKFLDNNTSFVVWSSLYSTHFLNTHNLRFTPGILLEDGDFTTRAYLQANRVVTTDYTDYQYRIRPGSILTSNNAARMSESEEIVIKEFLKQLSITKSSRIRNVLQKAIYSFMRDWTQIVSRNRIKLNKNVSCFDEALQSTKYIRADRPFKERLKFNTKVAIIKIKKLKK